MNINNRLIAKLSAIRKRIEVVPHSKNSPHPSKLLLEKREGYNIIIQNSSKWMKLMRQLHETYWSWINKRGVKFNYPRFIRLCTRLWDKVNHIGVYVNYKKIHKKYQTIQSNIPRAHGIIRDFTDPDRILLVKHHNDNIWSLPGGKLEHGETYNSALLRELYEEVDFNPSRNVVFVGGPNFMGINTYYNIWVLPRNKPKTNSPFEIDKVQWFSLKSMPPLTKLTKTYLNNCRISYKNVDAISSGH